MNRRLSPRLTSLLLVGILASACGDDAEPSTNKPPIVTGPTVQFSDVSSGTEVALALEATDPNGDALTYSWIQSPTAPEGTFSDPSAKSPVWTAPPVTSVTAFQLGVTVSDGKDDGTVRRSVQVRVRPATPTNRSPTLAAGTPSASPAAVTGAVPIRLTLSASDADGDPLNYSWTQEPASPVGFFNNRSASNPTWTAPEVSSPRNFTLKVTVSDGKGGTVQGQVEVNVAPPNHQNTAPVLTAGPSASSTTVDEQQPITLAVSATDADGNTLTYAWSQIAPASPVGTFSSTSVANPSWTAPNVTANGTYTLRVIISDGQGGSVQGTVDIQVRKVNQAPTVGASINAPTTLLAGETGTFSITASDPDGDTLSYAWAQTDPATPGTWVGGTTGASAQWYSPALSTQTSFTFSVTVTDGQSTPVVRTVTVPVTVPLYADIQNIWNTAPSCTGCHGTNGGNLNLGEGVSYANLVNITAVVPACNTLKRVTPGDPDNSVLIRKMEGSACGDRMPQTTPNYFSQNPGLVVRVRSWILAGANND